MGQRYLGLFCQMFFSARGRRIKGAPGCGLFWVFWHPLQVQQYSSTSFLNRGQPLDSTSGDCKSSSLQHWGHCCASLPPKPLPCQKSLGAVVKSDLMCFLSTLNSFLSIYGGFLFLTLDERLASWSVLSDFSVDSIVMDLTLLSSSSWTL